MANQYVYTDAEKTTIKTGENNLPLFFDDEKDDQTPAELNGFHLLDKTFTLQKDISNTKAEKTKLTEVIDIFKTGGIEVDDKDKALEWVNNAIANNDKVANFNEKDFVGVEKVEAIKQSAREAMEEKVESLKNDFGTKIDNLEMISTEKDKTIRKLMIDDTFNTSKFVSKELAQSPRVIRKLFGDNFKVEKDAEGKSVVLGYLPGEKEPIGSKINIGDPATFDEALNIMISKDTDRDSFIVGSSNSGTGGAGGTPGNIGDDDKQYKAHIANGNTAAAIALKNKQFFGSS